MTNENMSQNAENSIVEELQQRRSYDLALKNMQKDVKESYREYIEAENEVNDLESSLKAAKKSRDAFRTEYISKSQQLSKMVESDLKNYQQSLLDYVHDGESDKESNPGPPAPNTDSPQDRWKAIPAREFFQFTDKEWESLEGHTESDDPLSVGRLAQHASAMEQGTKFDGFGPAKLEKIKTQFMKFWESDLYKHSLVGDGDSEAGNSEKVKDKSEEVELEPSNPNTPATSPQTTEIPAPQATRKVDLHAVDDLTWEDYQEEIEEMLNDDAYAFAQDTLTGILEWVIEKQHITDKQIEAVENIRRSVEEREDCFE